MAAKFVSVDHDTPLLMPPDLLDWVPEDHLEFQAKEQERTVRAWQTGKKPRKRAPKPPEEGSRAKDQFNFTDPESRIMNTPDGFEQSYNAQAAAEIDSRLLVGVSVNDAPNDKE